MEVLTLDIQNFMSLGHAKLGLASKGLVLIQGSNADDSSAKSNGSGKSSIPDALSWCLYGQTARGESGDSIVNRTVGKGTRVRAVLGNDTGEVFSVTRHRKHSTGKNRLMVHRWPDAATADRGDLADAVDMTSGTDRLTQELVERLLSCPVDVFNAAIYAGQERMPNLPGMTDKELKTLIEESAGISLLQAAYEEARRRRTEKAGEAEKLQQTMLNEARNVSRLEEQITQIKALRKEWDEQQGPVLVEAEKRYLDAHRKQQALEKNELVVLKELAEVIAEQVAVRTRIADSRVKTDSLKTMDVEVRKTENVLISAKSKLQMLGEDVKRRKSAYDNVGGRVGTPCGECGKKIEPDDLAHALEAHKRDLNASIKTFKSAKEGVDAQALTLSELRSSRDAYAATVEDWSASAERLAQLATRRAELEEVRGEAGRAASDVETKKIVWKAEVGRSNPHDATVLMTESSLCAANNAYKEANALFTTASSERKELDQAVEVFGPAGVRAHILDHVTPFLNARTSHYLNILADGNLKAVWSTLENKGKGEVREKFNIDVQSVTAGTSFGSLSGGEKRKVRLATALALQDLIASRASQPIALFIADEIDDALDAAGLERLMIILEEKARERGTVLVISHNSLVDWIREVVEVKKKDGISTVSGALVAD